MPIIFKSFNLWPTRYYFPMPTFLPILNANPHSTHLHPHESAEVRCKRNRGRISTNTIFPGLSLSRREWSQSSFKTCNLVFCNICCTTWLTGENSFRPKQHMLISILTHICSFFKQNLLQIKCKVEHKILKLEFLQFTR